MDKYFEKYLFHPAERQVTYGDSRIDLIRSRDHEVMGFFYESAFLRGDCVISDRLYALPYEEMFCFMKNVLGDAVQTVRFTHKLKTHPVCLSNEGMLSADMERVLNSMPGNQGVKAELALEINENHPIAEKLKDLYATDQEKLTKYTKLLYGEARLIGGMQIEDPTEFATLVCELM